MDLVQNKEKVLRLLDARTSVNLETGCWEYDGTNADGYGQITIDQKFYYVHRISAVLFLGYDLTHPTLHVLHRCHNRKCWNFTHLYLGTNEDNIADKVATKTGRGSYSDVTHCIHGHEFTEENTYWSKRATGEMRRQCRECRKINDKRTKQNKILKLAKEVS